MCWLPRLSLLGPIGATVLFTACGFAPKPRSGLVACDPQGGACCPEGYLCVGRTDAALSLGTCWYKDDLPPVALVLAHDHTPAVRNDPACLVTDWVPWAGTGGSGGTPDSDVADASAPLDEGVVDVAASQDSAALDLAIGDDGDTRIDAPSPGPVTITSVSVAGGHACAVVNGGARCWGDNWEGQLGDGTTLDKPLPVQVLTLEAGVSMVKSGIDHACAIVNGAARCWGSNGGCGMLGDNTRHDHQLVPVPVVGLDSGVTDIAPGLGHTCAVVNGGAFCWGSNLTNELGINDGTRECKRVPVQVAGLTSGVTAIVAGSAHTCALVNGGMLCWGANQWGQLGDNTTTERATPTPVIGLERGVTSISANFHNTCAVVDGAARCWGENISGELGDGTSTERYLPVQVLTLTSNVTSISAGTGRTCAIVGGAGSCWGEDPYGSDLSESDHVLQPMKIAGLETGVRSISAGGYSCALVAEGVKCWGLGLLGDGAEKHRGTPVDVLFP